MFCRFGSLELSRPVAATTWLNDVWTRPVSGWIIAGSASTYVFLSLAILAVLDDLRRQRVRLGQLFEHVGVGAGAGLRFLDDRQPEFLEQHLRELLGRGDVERVAGQLFDFLLQLR